MPRFSNWLFANPHAQQQRQQLLSYSPAQFFRFKPCRIWLTIG
ncbi:MAG: hypothetical protein U1E91_04325 [Moraxella sp.]